MERPSGGWRNTFDWIYDSRRAATAFASGSFVSFRSCKKYAVTYASNFSNCLLNLVYILKPAIDRNASRALALYRDEGIPFNSKATYDHASLIPKSVAGLSFCKMAAYNLIYPCSRPTYSSSFSTETDDASVVSTLKRIALKYFTSFEPLGPGRKTRGILNGHSLCSIPTRTFRNSGYWRPIETETSPRGNANECNLVICTSHWLSILDANVTRENFL
mmetsp:Transcript_674/g.1557  ORF Transcript_674/g.1557 Transcript_674/m.1557 type:complete len:218 (-) Transcript_674:1040-1693(-)